MRPDPLVREIGALLRDSPRALTLDELRSYIVAGSGLRSDSASFLAALSILTANDQVESTEVMGRTAYRLRRQRAAS